MAAVVTIELRRPAAPVESVAAEGGVINSSMASRQHLLVQANHTRPGSGDERATRGDGNGRDGQDLIWNRCGGAVTKLSVATSLEREGRERNHRNSAGKNRRRMTVGEG